MRMVRLLDEGLRRPVEGKARDQQIIVPVPRSRAHQDFDLSGCHRAVLRAERNAIGLPQQKSAQACMIARRRSKLSVRR